MSVLAYFLPFSTPGNRKLFGFLMFSGGRKRMRCFYDNYGLKTLIRKPKCYKNTENLTCIDLMLTNVPRSF